MLVAGCTPESAAVPVVAATEAARVVPAAGVAVLERWENWVLSGVSADEADAYPELPNIADCEKDDASSEFWFVSSPRTGADKWTCTVPVGRSLVLVPASLTVTGGLDCESTRDTVGVDGSATVDGKPVALVWTGPVAKFEESALCALWGTTGPLSAGSHTVEMSGRGVQDKRSVLTVTVK